MSFFSNPTFQNIAKKVSAKASGFMASDRATQAGDFIQSFAPAARKGLAFAARHHGLTGAALGGAGGYISSGGDAGGAMTGAMVGGTFGGLGGMRYRGGRAKKGLTNLGGSTSWSGLGRKKDKVSGQIGRMISKASPDLAQSYGPRRSMVSFDISEGRFPRMQSVSMSSDRIGDVAGEGMKIRSMTGHARNMGGKHLGALAVGGALAVSAGGFGGGAWSFGTAPIKATTSTFRNQMGAVYGNSFSGMGNGSVARY